MSSAPLAQYFQLRTNMSRQNCSYLVEHFRLDAETGLLECVSVYEDGVAYHSAPAPFRVPVQAVPSTASAYATALAKAEASQRKRKEKADIEKAQRKAVDAMRKGLAALSQPAPAAARPAHAQVVSAPVATRAEASLPLPAVVVPAAPAVLSTGPQLLDDFTVIDLEFQVDNLLEIAAIRYQNWEPVGEYVSFVRFREKLWGPVTQLTGITSMHVYDAPEEKHVLQQLRKLTGDSLLVCHSIGADKRVLEAARTRQGATAELSNPWLCTLALARKRLPKGQKCGLGELCQLYKIKVRGAHRAKADVQMCYQVLRALHEQQPITKGDLHGAPQLGKGKKLVAPVGPGLFVEAA